MLESQPLVPQDGTLLEDKVFIEIIKLTEITGLGPNPG